MKKDKLSNHQDIILEALGDYRRWFDDIQMTLADHDKVKVIDKAIEFMENLK